MTQASEVALPATTREGARLGSREAWALALVATFTMSVSYVDRQALSVLAPTVTRAFHMTDAEYGVLVSAFSVAYLVGAPIAGRLVDLVGARRGLLGAVLAWSVIAALHALAPGFGALLFLRIALGLAEAPSFPGAAQTVHRALPPAERARGYGILFTGSSIGAMAVPPIATALEHAYGFRIAFLLTAVVGLVWLPIWYLVAFRPRARRALDHPPEDAPAASDATARISTLAILRHPAMLRAAVLIIASAPFIAIVLNWGAKYLVHDQHLTQSDVGRYLWFPPILFDAGAVAFGFLSSRRARSASYDGSPDCALVAAATALAVAGALMPFAGGAWPAMIVAGVGMAGGGGLYALITADVLARVPPNAVSGAGGLCAAAQSVAYIVFNPLIGKSIDRTHSYTLALVGLALWTVPGALVWLLWKPPLPWAMRARG